MTVYVYGSSDDRIEIDGSLVEEFYHMDQEPYYLGFSDGTLLKITYDGEWNIKVIEGDVDDRSVYPAEHAFIKEINESAGIDCPTYSDLAIIHSDVTWVVGGTDVVK